MILWYWVNLCFIIYRFLFIGFLIIIIFSSIRIIFVNQKNFYRMNLLFYLFIFAFLIVNFIFNICINYIIIEFITFILDLAFVIIITDFSLNFAFRLIIGHFLVCFVIYVGVILRVDNRFDLLVCFMWVICCGELIYQCVITIWDDF